MRARLLAVFALAAVVVGCPTAWSAPNDEPYSAIVAGVGGPCEWLYILTNNSDSADYVIWLLQIEVDEGVVVESASSPYGWTVDLNTESIAMWMTSSRYVPAGSSLKGFRAKFNREPAYQFWTVMFRNKADQTDSPVAFGIVDLPEPGSVVVVIIGLATTAARFWGRRGRS
ncbi:MAG: hypothetical protein N3B12_08860 [Armatimonadetes bacterium]|nr:hypothetical protein [Armatimonadota bacterium]